MKKLGSASTLFSALRQSQIHFRHFISISDSTRSVLPALPIPQIRAHSSMLIKNSSNFNINTNAIKFIAANTSSFSMSIPVTTIVRRQYAKKWGLTKDIPIPKPLNSKLEHDEDHVALEVARDSSIEIAPVVDTTTNRRTGVAVKIAMKETQTSLLGSFVQPHIPAFYQDIQAFVHHDAFESANRILEQVPTIEDFSHILMLAAKQYDFESSEYIFQHLKKHNNHRHIHVYNAMILACAACDEFARALELFQEMSELGISPNIATYEHLIFIYGKLQKLDQALAAYNHIRENNFPFSYATFANAIFACGACGDIATAEKIFQEAEALSPKPITKLNVTLLNAYICNDQLEKAIDQLKSMRKRSMTPDVITTNNILRYLMLKEDYATIKHIFESPMYATMINKKDVMHVGPYLVALGASQQYAKMKDLYDRLNVSLSSAANRPIHANPKRQLVALSFFLLKGTLLCNNNVFNKLSSKSTVVTAIIERLLRKQYPMTNQVLKEIILALEKGQTPELALPIIKQIGTSKKLTQDIYKFAYDMLMRNGETTMARQLDRYIHAPVAEDGTILFTRISESNDPIEYLNLLIQCERDKDVGRAVDIIAEMRQYDIPITRDHTHAVLATVAAATPAEEAFGSLAMETYSLMKKLHFRKIKAKEMVAASTITAAAEGTTTPVTPTVETYELLLPLLLRLDRHNAAFDLYGEMKELFHVQPSKALLDAMLPFCNTEKYVTMLLNEAQQYNITLDQARLVDLQQQQQQTA